jgi:hypothetical protein
MPFAAGTDHGRNSLKKEYRAIETQQEKSMSSSKILALSIVTVALWSALDVPASAQGLSATGAGDVEVAPKDTPEIGGDVISGTDDDTQAEVESKGVGDVDAEVQSED